MGEDLKIGTTILLLNGATSCVSRHIKCSLSALFFFSFFGLHANLYYDIRNCWSNLLIKADTKVVFFSFFVIIKST